MKRGSGILLHISSLPSKYGIGSFGREAYNFVDFLEMANQKYWQILPLGSTSYGDSPYQSFSTFAGNPYFIDFDILENEGILRKSEYENINWGLDDGYVDYEKVYNERYNVLRIAFKNGYESNIDKISEFKSENSNWVMDYALYMAVKGKFNNSSFADWDEDIKLRKSEAILEYSEELKEDINFWIFIQYHFFKQWNELKEYANSKNIKIIGDLPIYVSYDSADTWANSDVFYLDPNMNPIEVAGCPPDYFSEKGQLWGNPLYKWDYLRETNYKWWIKRIESASKLYDIIRIDHFRGLESYFSIPFGNSDATIGEWRKGPGIELINTIKNKFGNLEIIAEDLGYLTEDVNKLLEYSGFPGMKVLHFAFNPYDESYYLPHRYDKNCVCYTGTHDNDTTMGWILNSPKEEVEHAKKYLRLNEDEGYVWGFIRGVYSSVADIGIIPLQDVLNISSEGRMNTPSTIGENWKWRFKTEDLKGEIATKLRELSKLYGR